MLKRIENSPLIAFSLPVLALLGLFTSSCGKLHFPHGKAIAAIEEVLEHVWALLCAANWRRTDPQIRLECQKRANIR